MSAQPEPLLPGSADPIGVSHPASKPCDETDARQTMECAQRIAETVLGPNAARADLADRPLEENFRALGEANLLGLAIPQAYGGKNVYSQISRAFIELLASYCGVTTFVQAQHQSVCRLIADGPNEAMKAFLLPKLARGEMMCAISFAHLRRPGAPVLSATPVEGGYRLSGKAPWVTGWGLMNQVVFGATLPDERFVYLWSPARREDFPDLFPDLPEESGFLLSSPPLRLCAMNASATVELTLEDWFIPQDHWLMETDRETMRANDRKGVLNGAAMPLGCAKASLRLLREISEKRPMPAIAEAHQRLSEEWASVQKRVRELEAQNDQPGFFEEGVAARAWCIELAVRAAHAAVTASSGAANLIEHPAQRLFREAMFYTVQAQTQEVMASTLERLSQS